MSETFNQGSTPQSPELQGSSHAAPAGTPAAATPSSTFAAEPRLRIWPAELIVIVQWSLIVLAQVFAPGTMFQIYAGFMGPMIGGVLFILWWLFASRLPWSQRWLGIAAIVATVGAALLLADPSVRGPAMAVFGLPRITLAIAVWLLISSFLRWPVRRAGLLALLVLGWGYFVLVRFDGVDGSFQPNLVYRWMPTAEDKFLAEGGRKKISPVVTDESTLEFVKLEPGDWPGFRGAHRDARLTGVRLVVDWDRTPPHQIWRHRVGPGWSSFAVVANRLYTQEQLAEDEAVICYDAATGEELWIHRDDVRFSETMAGPGPRATPTFHDGKIYALGAKGTLNCLDSITGSVVWTKDIAADSRRAKTPEWGYSSSPFIANGVVTVFAG